VAILFHVNNVPVPAV